MNALKISYSVGASPGNKEVFKLIGRNSAD